jgi:peptidylprolyl isomerase
LNGLNKERKNMSNELQIIDIVVGEGKEAVKGALITSHYTGWLDNGTKFDSSHDRNQPFQCVIGTGRVIQGWDQGIMGMKVGGKRKLIVPSHLAYGERNMGSLIPAHSNLTFEIELLEVMTRDE